MAFHGVLYRISEELEMENLQVLKFLCLGLIRLGKKGGIKDGKDLFLMLHEKGLLLEGDLSILRELMLKINRIDLLEQELGSSKEDAERELQTPGQAKVSPYRYMLFELSENMTAANMNHFKILIIELPKSKLQMDMTMLDIFIEMEKTGLLGENKLNVLKEKCEMIDQGLVEIIEKYQRNATEVMAAPQESSSSAESRKEQNAVSPRNSSVCFSHLPGHREAPLKMDQFYKMTSRPRGICLIVNNYNFSEARAKTGRNIKDRRGTDVDKGALSSVFSQLHFQIEISKDMTADKIKQKLKSYGTDDHRNYDCFVCCVLSHGENGCVLGTDGQQVAIRKLTTYFSSSKCPSLAGKPKVFFIQACQGSSYQQGLELQGSTGSKLQYTVDSNDQPQCIPDEADFLLGMATVDNYVSYRSPTTGTWYIQALCKHLLQSCPSGDDILSILTRVNNEVSTMYDEGNGGVQMPQPSFTLRKKLVFPMI